MTAELGYGTGMVCTGVYRAEYTYQGVQEAYTPGYIGRHIAQYSPVHPREARGLFRRGFTFSPKEARGLFRRGFLSSPKEARDLFRRGFSSFFKEARDLFRRSFSLSPKGNPDTHSFNTFNTFNQPS